MWKKISLLSAVFLAVISCGLDVEAERQEGNHAGVSFSVSVPAVQVKAAIDDAVTSKTEVREVNLFIYDRHGMLAASLYADSSSLDNLSADLHLNEEYTLLALANVGKITPCSTEAEMKAYVYSVSSVEEFISSGTFPMASESRICPVKGQKINVALEVLLSELEISFVCPPGFHFDLKSVRMLTAPLSVSPFSEASVPSGRGDWDSSTGSDCLRLMEGNVLRLYMLEDASSKHEVTDELLSSGPMLLPKNLPCIRFAGILSNSVGIVLANVDYNLVMDYKVIRNRRYRIELTLTEQGVFEKSCRVHVTRAFLQLDERSKVMFTGTKERLYCPVSAYSPVHFRSENPVIASVDGDGVITARSKGSTRIVAECPAIKASAFCNLTVYDASDDWIWINDPGQVYVAQRKEVGFISVFGGRLEMDCRSGGTRKVEVLDLTPSGTARTVSNEMVDISFDPAACQPGGKGKIALAFKKKASLSMAIVSPSGNIERLDMAPEHAGIALSLADHSLREDEFTDFSVGLRGRNNELLDGNDFDPELLDREYGDIQVALRPQDKAAAQVWAFDRKSRSGQLTALSAGSTGVSVDVSSRFTRLSGTDASDTETVNILPAFGEIQPQIGNVENRIFLTDNGRYQFKVEDFASGQDLSSSEIRIRHLQWDRQWDHGTAALTDELRAETAVSGSSTALDLHFGVNGSGPYAIRFVRRNPLTGREYWKQTELDACLMLECGPSIMWDESMEYDCDVEMIWNLHSSASASRLLEAFPKEDRFILFSRKGEYPGGGLAAQDSYGWRDVIYDWVSLSTFKEYAQENSFLDGCEVFGDLTANYRLDLFNPYLNQKCKEDHFYTDQTFADKYYGGRAVLFGVTLPPYRSIIRSVKHNCSRSSSFPGGWETDLHDPARL